MLSDNSNIEFSSLESLVYDICGRIQSTRKKILSLYSQCPMQLEIQILIFFYAEIQNNYAKARFLSYKLNPQAPPYIQYGCSSFTLYDKHNVGRCEIGVGQEQQKIYYCTLNMPAIFGYTLEEFSHITQIEQFIPYPIKWNHR